MVNPGGGGRYKEGLGRKREEMPRAKDALPSSWFCLIVSVRKNKNSKQRERGMKEWRFKKRRKPKGELGKPLPVPS